MEAPTLRCKIHTWQDIFLEYDVVILLEATIRKRQTLSPPKKLNNAFTVHNFPRSGNKPGGAQSA